MFDFSLSQIQNQILLTQFDATQVENQRQTDRGKQKKREKRLKETRLNFALFIVIASANIDI